MSRPQRIAQYIQRFAIESLIQHDAADERPDDAPPRAPEPNFNYATWDFNSFSSYVPFRSPANN
jgi:hypothetical protein